MKRSTLLVVVAGLIAAGCSSPRSWVYSPMPREAREPVVNAALAVPTMLDRRSNDNSNGTMLYLIPLMPWGTQDYPAPEGADIHLVSTRWEFRPPEDFARALAQEIDASRIFRESFFTERASTGDFTLQGEIVSTQFDGKVISYGLSALGPFLWFIGFPSSHVTEIVEVKFTLKRAGSEAPIWTYTMHGEDSVTKWIYAPGTDFYYDAILKAQVPAMLSSLEAAMRGGVAKATQ